MRPIHSRSLSEYNLCKRCVNIINCKHLYDYDYILLFYALNNAKESKKLYGLSWRKIIKILLNYFENFLLFYLFLNIELLLKKFYASNQY